MSTVADLQLDPDKEYEIVNGQPEEKVMGGAEHGWISGALMRRVGAFVEDHGLGSAFSSNTSFRIGANERLPDFAFVSAERIPQEGEPQGVWPIPPDLAVEVVSPYDVAAQIADKVREYLAGGVREVWVVEPRLRTVTVYRSETDVQLFTRQDDLVSPVLLPGFRCPVADLFRSRPRAEG